MNYYKRLIINTKSSPDRTNISVIAARTRKFKSLIYQAFQQLRCIIRLTKVRQSAAFLSMKLSIPLLLMISISFYLLTPKAKAQSALYVSISNKSERLRFPTGESFLTEYCNIRKKKGSKDLVKKNTPFYFEYKAKLEEIRNSLLKLEQKTKSLTEIKEAYLSQSAGQTPFDELYRNFIKENESGWAETTRKKFTGTYNHIRTLGQIEINGKLYTRLRDYLISKNYSNPSINKYLKALKQFMRYAQKKGIEVNVSELKYLEEIEPFKIALKEREVERLTTLDLKHNPKLDKVRDLFILEVLTGQRFSDLPKILDVKHISETNIQFYQHKTHEKVTIPLHPRLKGHLDYIFQKYPQGLPVISNQKFNIYLKELCILAGFNKQHSWVTLSGKKKIAHSDYRYNLITSHTGRRTFCTLALKEKINAVDIMKVTGHRSYDQFREYVKVDDEDLEVAFEGFLQSKA